MTLLPALTGLDAGVAVRVIADATPYAVWVGWCPEREEIAGKAKGNRTNTGIPESDCGRFGRSCAIVGSESSTFRRSTL